MNKEEEVNRVTEQHENVLPYFLEHLKTKSKRLLVRCRVCLCRGSCNMTVCDAGVGWGTGVLPNTAHRDPETVPRLQSTGEPPNDYMKMGRQKDGIPINRTV